MISRKLLSVFVLVFMAFLLVACGTDATPTPVEPTPTPVEPTPTPVEPTPTEEPTVTTRIYFYNSADWNNVSAYTFNPEFFGSWPGVLATQDGTSDWYYVDVPQDPTVTPINIIFNNGGGGSQTADIVIDSATNVYITVRNEVFGSKAAAEASFEEPVVTTRVYFYNSQNWAEVNAYTFGPELFGGWPGQAATREGDTRWYYVDVPANAATSSFNIIFNGGGSQTSDVEINNSTDVYVNVTGAKFASKELLQAVTPLNIVDTAIEGDGFNTLVAAVIEAELVAALSAAGPFTVFAPTDAAFADLLAELEITAEALLANPDLASILLFHVVAGEVLAADVLAAAPFYVETLNGNLLYIEVLDGKVYVNGAEVILADVKASNGVIHVIDAVLLPPGTIVEEAVASELFPTLVAALIEAGLVDTLNAEGPYTVFAPTEAAFQALLTELELTAAELLESPKLSSILLYHVLEGQFLASDVIAAAPLTINAFNNKALTITVVDGEVFVNNAKVVTTNILGSNGVIHVIDQVLVPEYDILETAAFDESFQTLLTALEFAELAEALKGEGPFTVFAPTDDAFTALLAELDITANALLADPNLSNILLYHVIAGEFLAADVIAAAPFYAETLNGTPVYIQVIDGQVFVDGAQVILADVLASNGVIHVLDAVLLPEDDIVDVAVLNEDFNVLVSALQTAELDLALRGEGPFTVFAPTDQAFTALLLELDITAEALLADPDLADILLYHVLLGNFSSVDVINAAPFYAETLNGSLVYIEVVDGQVFVGGAQVKLPNVMASNGVIHVIDSVLLPPGTVVEEAIAAEFDVLVEAVLAAGLEVALSGEGPFTVFAPTDAAFVALLAELGITKEALLADVPLLTNVLLYHVLSGQFLAADVIEAAPFYATTLNGSLVYVEVIDGAVFVGGAQVVLPNVLASNGVIHVIDTVLLPPGNIVEEAIKAEFDVLVSAVVEADLTDLLATTQTLTVFAPTDAAFEALLTELGITAEQLLASEDLASILAFHVVEGTFFSEEVIAAAPFFIETLNGDFLYIEIVNGSVLVNGATVVLADVLASNGVIHVIDAVLLPQTLIYETGFEASEGFTATTTYNNQTLVNQGPASEQWSFYYGTSSTTAPLSGAQSAQMRFYTSAVSNLGYTYTNFDLEDVSKIVFKAAGTNGVNVLVSVSSDGGTTWVDEEVFVLTSSTGEFIYLVDEALQTGNLRVKFQITFDVQPTATSRLYIDDVRIFS